MTDCKNHRVQVFDRNGKFLRKFGEYGSLDHQLKILEVYQYMTTVILLLLIKVTN